MATSRRPDLPGANGKRGRGAILRNQTGVGADSCQMAKTAPKKATICSVVDQRIMQAIEERRAPLTLSRSAYLGLILQKWLADGCPAVSSADSAILELRRNFSK